MIRISRDIAAALIFMGLWAFPIEVWAETVHLAWDPPVDRNISGYLIYRATKSGGPYNKLNSTPWSLTDYSDDTAQAGQTYYYTVTAVNVNGWESAFSQEATVTLAAYSPVSGGASLAVRTISDLTVASGQLAILTASVWNPENRTLSFSWVQSPQSTVQIIGVDKLEASFLAPVVIQDTTLTFVLTVRDSANSVVTDAVKVLIRPR